VAHPDRGAEVAAAHGMTERLNASRRRARKAALQEAALQEATAASNG
jgi:hypothetical protein